MRVLAKELGVNPMTVSKAYSILEVDGIVERRRGIGMVVIQGAGSPEEVLSPAIEKLIADAKQLGLSESQVSKMIKKHWGGR